jgi:hypothetical protein
MHTAMLKRMVRRIEERAGSSGGPCPRCVDWLRPVLLRGDAPMPPPCAACGREPFVHRLIKVDDFFHNRQRLDALEQDEEE